jgi:hypothetical protein
MTTPVVLVDLPSGHLLGITSDGTALRWRVESAPDSAYITSAGGRIDVRRGVVQGFRAAPAPAAQYKPTP